MSDRAQDNPVVITGMGAVSVFGFGVQPFWDGLVAGLSKIAPVAEHYERELKLKLKSAAFIEGYDEAAHFDARARAPLDRYAQYALLASTQAMAQAGLSEVGEELAPRLGVAVSTSLGGRISEDESATRYIVARHKGEWAPINPLSLPRTMGNAAASHVSMAFNARGPSYCVNTACATASHSIAMAMLMLRSGLVDVMIAGASDVTNASSVLKGWEAMRVLSTDTCRPFCAERKGLVLGEGSGVFVLETLAHARARGATPIAELAGFGLSSDARDLTRPDPQGAAAAIKAALTDARMNANEISLVNAHGTGTQANDEVETRALHIAFGEHARKLSISASKSIIGHAMGAGGALELIATVESLRSGIVHPTANFGTPAPECDLDYTPNTARERHMRAAITNSFAFGGTNAVLAVRSMEP